MRDVRVVEALDGDEYVVEYLMSGPGGSFWRADSRYEDKGTAIAWAEGLADSPGHSTANRVVWVSIGAAEGEQI